MKPAHHSHATRLRKEILPRALALFFGGFALLNVSGNLCSLGFDLNLWWLDLRTLPPVLANSFIGLAAVGLVAFACRAPRSMWRTVLTFALTSLLVLIALGNSVQFYRLLGRGAVHPATPVPLSLLVAAAMATIAAASIRPQLPSLRSQTVLPIFGAFLACLVAFPIFQMFFFGKTDYRRPADAVVVPGARVYRDGRPSDALADRVRTASRLYHDRLARKLIFSGGPGEGSVPETLAMKQLAIRLGVKADDILTDGAGLNTEATVNNTAVLLARLHATRVLVVSQFYHLPRLKMAYHRAGQEVYTVPVKESLLFIHPYNMLREVAAQWVYYLRPLTTARVGPHNNRTQEPQATAGLGF